METAAPRAPRDIDIVAGYWNGIGKRCDATECEQAWLYLRMAKEQSGFDLADGVSDSGQSHASTTHFWTSRAQKQEPGTERRLLMSDAQALLIRIILLSVKCFASERRTDLKAWILIYAKRWPNIAFLIIMRTRGIRKPRKTMSVEQCTSNQMTAAKSENNGALSPVTAEYPKDVLL